MPRRWPGQPGGLCTVVALGAVAQEFNDKPLQENWWPTEWGPTTRPAPSTAPRPRSC